jgi:hypothetical protein
MHKTHKLQVILPTGSRVQIDARKSKGKKAKKKKEKNGNYVEYLNIFITPSPLDWGHTTGLLTLSSINSLFCLQRPLRGNPKVVFKDR